MNYTFTSATILLLLITDPVGNIPIFVMGWILVAVSVEMLLRGFKAVALQMAHP